MRLHSMRLCSAPIAGALGVMCAARAQYSATVYALRGEAPELPGRVLVLQLCDRRDVPDTEQTHAAQAHFLKSTSSQVIRFMRHRATSGYVCAPQIRRCHTSGLAVVSDGIQVEDVSLWHHSIA